MASGRERRRKGPINRLRRVLYGLMLSLPHVASADPGSLKTAAPASYSQPAATSPRDAVWLEPGAEGFDQLIAGVRVSLVDPTRALQLPQAEDSLAATILGGPLYALRHGAELDFNLPHAGALHLNLFAKRNPRHWQLNPGDGDDGDTGTRPWSLGGAVELLKDGVSGHRTLAVIPQLVLDLDRLVGAPGQFEATLQYSPWRGSDDPQRASERMAQASVRWKF